MSLWVALIWLVCAVICAGTFLFCRKRLAEIAEEVSEEMKNKVTRILDTERNAEGQLLDAFLNFGNCSDAIQAYQKTGAEIFGNPQAKPPWNWSLDDLELWRKRAENKKTAGCARPVILTAVIVILALNTAAAVTSVVMLNTVKPVVMAHDSSVDMSMALAEQLPPLPTAWPTISTDDSVKPVDLPSFNVGSNVSDGNTAETDGFSSIGGDYEQ